MQTILNDLFMSMAPAEGMKIDLVSETVKKVIIKK
jgi:hypothetical protein